MNSFYVIGQYFKALIAYCEHYCPNNTLQGARYLESLDDLFLPVALTHVEPYLQLLQATPSDIPHEWQFALLASKNSKGMLQYAVANAETIHEAILLGQQFQNLATNISELSNEKLYNGDIRLTAVHRGSPSEISLFIFNSIVCFSLMDADRAYRNSENINSLNPRADSFSELAKTICRHFKLYDIQIKKGEYSVKYPSDLFGPRATNFDPAIKNILVQELQIKLKKLPKNYTLAEQVADYIRVNLNTDIKVDSVCHEFHVSRRTLSRMLEKEHTSFGQLLDSIRKTKAMRLMEDKSIPLKKVASEAGFKTASHFNTTFKGWTGETPAVYRKTLDV